MASLHTSLLRQTILALLIPFFTALPAHAHRINLFAWLENDIIHGSVYFAGGGKAQNVTIKVIAPDGKQLGIATTNARGEFTFKPTEPVDHRFIADSGDGHRAEFLLTADAIAGKSQPPALTTPPSSAPSLDPEADPAAAREIAALRQQLHEQPTRIRSRDVVAGIGYIVGLAGLAYYLAQRKAPRRSKL